jgi:hypothetical protein
MCVYTLPHFLKQTEKKIIIIIHTVSENLHVCGKAKNRKKKNAVCITGNDAIKKREGRKKLTKDVREWNKRIIMEILFFFSFYIEGCRRRRVYGHV